MYITDVNLFVGKMYNLYIPFVNDPHGVPENTSNRSSPKCKYQSIEFPQNPSKLFRRRAK